MQGHRTALQNAGSQKTKHSPWKYNSVWKKLINSYEKRPQNRLPKCLKPKKPTLHWKKHSVPNKTYKPIWKKATEPSSKIPEANKTTLSLKKQFFFLILINSYARAQNRLAKCRKPKNQTLSLIIQFCLKKAYKFIWKNATEPSSKMPEAKKANTFIEKTHLLQKSV